MKLSEAIRLGAMMGPQSFHRSGSGPGQALCANLGALKAVGGFNIIESWPWLREDQVCPVCAVKDMCCGVIATHLNDGHHWTRERIADWVATIEPAEVHASETIREVQSGQGPLRSPLEVENAETKTILI